MSDTMRQAVRQSMWDAMTANDETIMLGEALNSKGGACQLAFGFNKEFGPDRAIETPISENALVGSALGAALAGLRVLCEVYSADFLFCAGSEVINDIAKWRYLHQWTDPIHLVLRMPMGSSGISAGPEHCQNIEGLLHHVPGLRVVVPSSADIAYEALRCSLECGDPVIFLEHRALYDVTTSSAGRLPISLDSDRWRRGEVVRSGSDATVVAWGRMLGVATEAADALAADGVDIEVVDPISVKPFPFDLVIESVRKTGRLVVVQEAPRTGGVAAEVITRCHEELGGAFLDAVRLTMPDAPHPYHSQLESSVLPSAADVRRAVSDMVAPSSDNRRK